MQSRFKDSSTSAGTIIRWLRDEDILHENVLLKLNPRADCPADWPLGWKINLEIFINELKSGDIRLDTDSVSEVVVSRTQHFPAHHGLEQEPQLQSFPQREETKIDQALQNATQIAATPVIPNESNDRRVGAAVDFCPTNF